MGCDGTPTQICTCSSDFLLRIMMRAAVFGAGLWKPFFTRLHVSEVLVTKSTKSSCFRLPAAEIIMLPGEKRCL